MTELEHHHHHEHSHSMGKSKLIFVIILNFIITFAQIIGGIFSGSLSLISDAVHNFSDGLAIIISFIAIKVSEKMTDKKRTFGYKRATIIAGFINSTVLVIISFYLFKEAYIKFIKPQSINGNIVIWVALLGFIANLLSVILLKSHHHHDVNIKSSYLHLLGDTLSSVAVIIGGIIISLFNIFWIDPVLTILINIYILKQTYEIFKKVFNVLMEGIPENINLDNIISSLEKIDLVKKVHHVHVWSIDENNIYLEGHVNIEDMPVSCTLKILENINKLLKDEFRINHTTIQFECDFCKHMNILCEN